MDRVDGSFYHFFHSKPSGRHRIYLSNTLIAKMSGYREVYDTLEQETGVRFGETDEAGMFGLWSPTSTRGGRCSSVVSRITRRCSKTASPARPTRRSAPLPNPGYADMVVQGFETGLKWQLCRAAPGDEKHVICNADKGDPARSRTGRS